MTKTEAPTIILQDPEVYPSTLLPINQFMQQVPTLVDQAEKQVWHQAMYFTPDPEVEPLLKALERAGDRGVDTRFAFDDVSYLAPTNFITLFRRFWSLHTEKYQQAHLIRQQKVDSLRDHEVKVKILREAGFGKDKESLLKLFLPVVKTNHQKIVKIDDVVGIFGANTSGKDFTRLDAGVFMTRPDIVQTVSTVMDSVWNKRTMSDDFFKIGEDYQLAVDWGEFNTSRIYEEALGLIGRTKEHLSIGSQYVADRNVLEEVKKVARKGARVDIYTSPISHNKFKSMPHIFEYLRSLRTICDEPNMMLYHHPTTEMHLKMMVRDNEEALWGSHNFVWMGVFLATAEIAMLTKDPRLVPQFTQFFKNIDRHYFVKGPY